MVDKGYGIDYAEKLLPQTVGRGLLVRLENRLGKQYQYVLSNFVHLLKPKDPIEKEDEVLPSDVSLILARELSCMKYVYHNIHLVTDLNYKDDYNVLKWSIPSQLNKQKIRSFTLEPKRSVNFRISPDGTANISIDCTYHPFEFHTTNGFMNFFGICGQIFTYLQLCTKNRLNVVPWFGEWNLMQFDYNKDLSTKYLKNKYSSQVISWSSKGVLKLYYLGVIFQIYCKTMPYIGECLRAEDRFSTKEKVKMTDSISRIVTAAAFRMYVKEMPEQGPCLRVELNNSFKDSMTLSEKMKEIAKGDDAEYTPEDFLKVILSEINRHTDNNARS